METTDRNTFLETGHAEFPLKRGGALMLACSDYASSNNLGNKGLLYYHNNELGGLKVKSVVRSIFLLLETGEEVSLTDITATQSKMFGAEGVTSISIEFDNQSLNPKLKRTHLSALYDAVIKYVAILDRSTGMSGGEIEGARR